MLSRGGLPCVSLRCPAWWCGRSLVTRERSRVRMAGRMRLATRPLGCRRPGPFPRSGCAHRHRRPGPSGVHSRVAAAARSDPRRRGVGPRRHPRRGAQPAGGVRTPVAYQLFRMGYYASLTPARRSRRRSAGPWSAGWAYLHASVEPYWLWIPLVIALVFGYAPLLHDLVTRRRRRAIALVLACFSAGLLHALFVVRVGGDFYHARLLLPALFLLLAPVAVVPWRKPLLGALFVLPWAVLALGFLRSLATIRDARQAQPGVRRRLPRGRQASALAFRRPRGLLRLHEAFRHTRAWARSLRRDDRHRRHRIRARTRRLHRGRARARGCTRRSLASHAAGHAGRARKAAAGALGRGEARRSGIRRPRGGSGARGLVHGSHRRCGR